jgi:hypothetical protein
MPRVDVAGTNTIALTEPINANIGSKFNVQVQKMFSLYLWYPSGGVPELAGLDPSGTRPTAEFFFFTPPKSVSIDDPFATRVIGTQNGGKFTESHGSIFKTIRVNGTTGFRPRAGLPASIPGPASLVRNVQNAINTIGSSSDFIPETEVTGYDDAMFLKNIFRAYSDMKTAGIPVMMIWRDLKDDEEWVVEPRNSRFEKNSKSPLTYTYVLDLNGLAKFHASAVGNLSSFKDVLNADTSLAKRITQINEWRNQTVRALLVLSTQLNRVSGFVSKGADLLLGSVAQALRALNTIASSAKNVGPSISRIIRESLVDIERAAEELAANVNSGGPIFPDRTDNSLEFRNALNRLAATFRGVLVSPIVVDSAASSHNVRSAATRSAYRATDVLGTNQFSSPASAAGAPGGSVAPGVVDEGRVLEGETIRDVAARLTGSSVGWHDLVILNDLTAPYTSDSGSSEGVLSPGDPILFPSTGKALGRSGSSFSTEEDSALLKDSLAARAYGRDLRLVSSILGPGAAASDLSVNQLGDISSIAGVDNVNQAVLVKFSTEKGELPGYAFFGASATIGSKLNSHSFNTFRNSTIATILSDSRVKDIQKINFSTNADVLSVAATLTLSNSNDYLTTNFALRRL